MGRVWGYPLFMDEDVFMPNEAMVFDISRFAVHDGPGIRTTVFLKGCTNRCGWCHNPESISPGPELQIYPGRCVGCGKCAEACKTGARTIDADGIAYDRRRCARCGACAEACNAQALVLCGKRMSAEAVFDKVLEDAPYYKTSGGGMTVSGGEPVLWSGFCAELFALSRKAGIHAALETAGNYPYAMLAAFVRNVDLVLFDLKALSEELYAAHIRADAARILKTLEALDGEGVKIAVRTPVVGGVNDSEAEIEGIAKRLKRLSNLAYYQLIPYHALGKAKYDALSLPYDVPYFSPSPEAMSAFERAAARHVAVFNPQKGYV